GAHRTGRRPARHGPPRRPVGGGDRAREPVTDRSGGMPLTRPLFAAALLASATALAEGPQTLTIDDTARSARGRLLPALSASDTWQHWDGPFIISLAPPGTPSSGVVARNVNSN